VLDRNGQCSRNYAAYTPKSRRPAVDLESLINELATGWTRPTASGSASCLKGHDFSSLPIRTRLNDVE
jgi:hypothetical protein